MTLPDSSFLPAPLWVITALHVLTLSLHFVAMNFVLGGTLIVLMGRFERRWENPTVRRFIALFPSVMAATVTLGVAPLLFLQLVYPRQMYSAAIVSGWFWLLVIPAVIATYYLFHAACRPGNAAASSKARFLWPALCGLLYVSLLYSSVFSLAEHPGLIQQLYARSQTGFQWNPHLGNYLFRWLHMVLGAVTVGAYFVGLLGKDDPETFPVARRLFGFGMAAAAAAGFAYLVSLQEILPGLMRTPGDMGAACGHPAVTRLPPFLFPASLSSLGPGLICLSAADGQCAAAGARAHPARSFFSCLLEDCSAVVSLSPLPGLSCDCCNTGCLHDASVFRQAPGCTSTLTARWCGITHGRHFFSWHMSSPRNSHAGVNGFKIPNSKMTQPASLPESALL